MMVAAPAAGHEPSWRRVLSAAGVRDARIVQAMEQVRRGDFLPRNERAFEMENRPLDIGHGQTTSQPSLIALMLQELQITRVCHVLEVGTGCGYQTALIAQLAAQVFSIDILEPLALEAQQRLAQRGVLNAELKVGDGYLGWPEHAPFDAIVVSASVPRVPPPLVEQLKKGGRLAIPVGTPDDSKLLVFEKDVMGKVSQVKGIAVRFVPLLGENAERDRQQ